MSDPTERTLKLLGLLQAHRQWSGEELAARLGTTQRTVRRDIERLRGLGYPVESLRGTGGGYQLAAGAALPPLLVDEDEAVAIVTALRSAATGAAAGLGESSVRALAKVTQVLPNRLRRRVEAVQSMSVTEIGDTAPPIDAQALSTLALACRDQVQVQFGYAKARADGKAERRRVEPLRLVPVGRRWYLVGFDLDRADWRTFRLDRLTDPQPTSRTFRPRELPGGDAAAFVSAGLRKAQDDSVQEVVAKVGLPAVEVERRIGRYASIEGAPDDPSSTLVRMLHPLGWTLLMLGSLDADYDLVEVSEQTLRELRGWNARQQRAMFLAEKAAYA